MEYMNGIRFHNVLLDEIRGLLRRNCLWNDKKRDVFVRVVFLLNMTINQSDII